MTRLPTLRALTALMATGVLAGGALYLGWTVGPRVEGHGGEVGGAVAAVGVLASAGLLAAVWWTLAPAATALLSAASTVFLAGFTTALFIVLTLGPVDAAVCPTDDAEFCGLGLVVAIPAVGAVVPWTIAGIPGLLVVLAAHRRRVADEARIVDPPTL